MQPERPLPLPPLRLMLAMKRNVVPLVAVLGAAAALAGVLGPHRSELKTTVGLTAMILLLLGAFGFFYRRSASAGRDQQRAYTELEGAQCEGQRLLAQAVESAETERTRIAADLHDGPIQRLTAAAFSLDLLERRLARGEQDSGALVQEIREQLSGEMEGLRRLMTELTVADLPLTADEPVSRERHAAVA